MPVYSFERVVEYIERCTIEADSMEDAQERAAKGELDDVYDAEPDNEFFSLDLDSFEEMV